MQRARIHSRCFTRAGLGPSFEGSLLFHGFLNLLHRNGALSSDSPRVPVQLNDRRRQRRSAQRACRSAPRPCHLPPNPAPHEQRCSSPPPPPVRTTKTNYSSRPPPRPPPQI